MNDQAEANTKNFFYRDNLYCEKYLDDLKYMDDLDVLAYNLSSDSK